MFAKRPEGKEICSGIGNFGMNSSNLVLCLLSIVRSFNFTRQCFLSLPQFVTKALEVLRIDNFLSITCSNQRGNACINSYCFINLRQGVDSRVINQQRDKPASRRIQSYCYRGRFTTCGKSTTPANWQRVITLCQPQLPVLPSKSCTSKLSAATTSLLFEVGIFGATCPKVSERMRADFSTLAAMEQN